MGMINLSGDLEPSSVRTARGAKTGRDVNFTPVAAPRSRYRRGSTWAARRAVGEPDIEKLRFMRHMERTNRG